MPFFVPAARGSAAAALAERAELLGCMREGRAGFLATAPMLLDLGDALLVTSPSRQANALDIDNDLQRTPARS